MSDFGYLFQHIIAAYGTSLTYTRDTAGAYDPATGTASTTAATPDTITGAFQSYNERELTQEHIQVQDRKLYFRPGTGISAAPEIGDTIAGVGDAVQIIALRRVAPGGDVVGFVAQVR